MVALPCWIRPRRIQSAQSFGLSSGKLGLMEGMTTYNFSVTIHHLGFTQLPTIHMYYPYSSSQLRHNNAHPGHSIQYTPCRCLKLKLNSVPSHSSKFYHRKCHKSPPLEPERPQRAPALHSRDARRWGRRVFGISTIRSYNIRSTSNT